MVSWPEFGDFCRRGLGQSYSEHRAEVRQRRGSSVRPGRPRLPAGRRATPKHLMAHPLSRALKQGRDVSESDSEHLLASLTIKSLSRRRSGGLNSHLDVRRWADTPQLGRSLGVKFFRRWPDSLRTLPSSGSLECASVGRRSRREFAWWPLDKSIGRTRREIGRHQAVVMRRMLENRLPRKHMPEPVACNFW